MGVNEMAEDTSRNNNHSYRIYGSRYLSSRSFGFPGGSGDFGSCWRGDSVWRRGGSRSPGIFSSLLVLGLAALACAGCGPTRKEYAINEALLIDQTRTLEDQLYCAHFQIQRLETENQLLREKLEGKSGDSDSSEDSDSSGTSDSDESDSGSSWKSDGSSRSSVPFEAGASPNTVSSTPPQAEQRHSTPSQDSGKVRFPFQREELQYRADPNHPFSPEPPMPPDPSLPNSEAPSAYPPSTFQDGYGDDDVDFNLPVSRSQHPSARPVRMARTPSSSRSYQATTVPTRNRTKKVTPRTKVKKVNGKENYSVRSTGSGSTGSERQTLK